MSDSKIELSGSVLVEKQSLSTRFSQGVVKRVWYKSVIKPE